MQFTQIRERLFTFFLPIICICVLLGGGIWLVMTRFFWDASSLTVALQPDIETVVQLQVSAQIFDYDISVPSLLRYGASLLLGSPVGGTYPLSLTIPWSQKITCRDTCEFKKIPAGNGSLRVFSLQDDRRSMNIVIAPDTRGEIDLRPDIIFTDMTDLTPFIGPLLRETEAKNLIGTQYSLNQFHSLMTLRGDQGEFIHDILSRQSIQIPESLDAQALARGSIDGVYLIFTGKSVFQFDRFGRTPLTQLTSYVHENITLSWTPDVTQITLDTKTRTLSGWWWILEKDQKTYLSNGTRVVSYE